MSLYTDIETPLIAVLKAEPDLQGVKVVEAEIKDALFLGAKLSQGFRADQLPAINLSLSLAPTKSQQFTTGEIRYDVPVSIVAIASATNATAARDLALDLAAAIARVLNTFRRSGNPLGPNTLVTGDVSLGTASVTHEQPFHFAWVTTDATILKIVSTLPDQQ